ncbi:MAG: hypothetical protein QXP39_02565 [Candidatus Aenigmatarchaeota archaeon]
MAKPFLLEKENACEKKTTIPYQKPFLLEKENACEKKTTDMYVRGQTTLILMIITVMIFIGMAIFLLYFAQTITITEYEELYAHEMLTAIIRSGGAGPECPECWMDKSCRYVSDLIGCYWTKAGYVCRSASPQFSCDVLAVKRLNESLQTYAGLKPGYEYFLAARPVGFAGIQDFIYVNVSSSDRLLKWYECYIGKSRTGCRLPVTVAHQFIPVSGTSGISVTLAITKRAEK